MGDTGANVFDEFRCFGIKMSKLIIVFIRYGLIRMVEFSNVGSGDVSMFFDEFGEGFLKKFFLILVRGDKFFEIRY